MAASAVFVLTAVFRWPLFLLLSLMQCFRYFGFIFLVYPGDPSHTRRYVPRWLEWLQDSRHGPSRLSFIGLVKYRHGCHGLVLAVPSTAQALARNQEMLRTVVAKLCAAARFLRVQHVALAGRLSSLLEARGIERPPEIVSGAMGTVFMLSRAIGRVTDWRSSWRQPVKVVIFGIGALGRQLAAHLESKGLIVWSIHGKKGAGQDALADAKAQLEACHVVVVLTATGSQFYPYMNMVGKDAVILDDTHPPMRRRPAHATAYRVVAGLPGLRFVPRLPGFAATWVPGCLVEAIVRGQSAEDLRLSRQDTFDRLAEEIGFDVRLIPLEGVGDRGSVGPPSV